MPPLPVIANVYRVFLHWNDGAGQNAGNVIHIKSTSGSPTVAEIESAIDTAVDAGMWGPVSNGFAVDDVAVTPLDGTSATEHFSTGEPAKWTGNVAGQAIPQVAAIVKFTTTETGRSKRGRVFLPAISESVVDLGALDSAVATNTGAAWSEFNTDLGTDAIAPCELVVASYKLATALAITGISCELQTGTQRRRQQRNRV
jgi:hypothetical protein